MAKTTRLTQQDLQIYPSQRLTDTPDGGGLMTGTPLTGEDNEIFPPVSDVDRTMGSFDARLLYPGVLRNDAEPLYGAHFIISEPPAMGNVSFLAFKARNYGELRSDIMPRIEAYSVPTVESRMTLLGRHMAGIRMVQAYQRTEAPLPKVGERYCLEMRETAGNKSVIRSQYFRIADLSHEVRTFEVPSGGGIKEIQRRVLKMEIYNPLTEDYNGVEYPAEGYVHNGTRILETQVADSASYYGVRRLAEALKKNAAELRVDSIYEKLVPTSTVETAYADQYPVFADSWVPSGAERVVFSTQEQVSGTIWLEHPVIPGSVKITGWEDDAQGRLTKGDSVVSIDYKRGMITNMPRVYGLEVTAVSGVQQSTARYSTYVAVKDTNQGTQWAPLLQPAPARGSLTVSFMTLGVWYQLSDKGDGILRDAQGTSCGLVESNGSAVVSLPAMPDVGSNIVFAWGDSRVYETYSAAAAGSAYVAKSVSAAVVIPERGRDYIKPGTLRMAWGDNKTATDSAGTLTGDATGYVDYAGGRAVVSDGLSAHAVKITYEAYTGEAQGGNITPISGSELDLTVGKTAPGTLILSLAYAAKAEASEQQWIQAKYNGLHGSAILRGSVIAAVEKHNLLVNTNTQKVVGTTSVIVLDDGKGGLLCDGAKLKGASINYTTGKIYIPAPATTGIGVYVSGADLQSVKAVEGAKAHTFGRAPKVLSNVQVVLAGGTYSHLADTATRQVSLAETPANIHASVISGALSGGRPVLDTWAFSLGDERIIERGGVLYKDFDYKTGGGAVVGNLDAATGKVTVSEPTLDLSRLKITAGIVVKDAEPIYQYSGRTEAAPVKPESFTVYAVSSGQNSLLAGTADAHGRITGKITGEINYETGFYTIEVEAGVLPDTLRYNAVTQDNIPLDSGIIGIDSVRLPSDGRVPVFRKGDMIVIGNRIKQEIGSAFTGGQVVALERRNSDRICLVDAKGKHVLAEKYGYSLAEGRITFADPLDLSDYTMPLTAVQAWEEENRVMGVDISGRLKLQFPVGRDYPQENTYVSSALIGGDLLVRATEPFSQQTWDNVWEDKLRGNPILARLDVKNYPIRLTSNGAVTERWLLQFTGDSQYELYGERLGLIAKGDTLTDLAPVNPATGKPYFTINRLAFGGGWAARNCVRFNTYGTPMPVWILRAVQPGTEKQTARDGFSACLRGNTVVEEQP